jgi:hypothetical protein
MLASCCDAVAVLRFPRSNDVGADDEAGRLSGNVRRHPGAVRRLFRPHDRRAPNQRSIGTVITTAGAALLATAVGILVYGFVTYR